MTDVKRLSDRHSGSARLPEGTSAHDRATSVHASLPEFAVDPSIRKTKLQRRSSPCDSISRGQAWRAQSVIHADSSCAGCSVSGFQYCNLTNQLLMSGSTYLHECAMEFRKPYYACFWESQLEKLVRDLSLYTTAKSAGEGFNRVADLLSEDSLPVFRELSILDRVMVQYRHLETGSREMNEILATRNAAVHALLCLPEWEDLDPAERTKTHRTVYDVCRLTCAIYVNAVIIGFPPHSKWHIRLCGRLRWLHESTLTKWPAIASDVLIWSLAVGSIAAFVSPHREYFEFALQRAIIAADWSKWSQIHDVLRTFVWDAHACQQGVAMLRERLGDIIDWG